MPRKKSNAVIELVEGLLCRPPSVPPSLVIGHTHGCHGRRRRLSDSGGGGPAAPATPPGDHVVSQFLVRPPGRRGTPAATTAPAGAATGPPAPPRGRRRERQCGPGRGRRVFQGAAELLHADAAVSGHVPRCVRMRKASEAIITYLPLRRHCRRRQVLVIEAAADGDGPSLNLIFHFQRNLK